MDDFQPDLTLIETVNARHQLFHIHHAIDAVDDLLPERVLMMVVNSEIGTESITDKGV